MSDPIRHSDAPFFLQTQTGSCSIEAPDGTHLLAAVGFANAPAQRIASLPVFDVGLPLLAGDVAHELWLSHSPVRYGQHEAITYSENGEVLFGHVLLDEVGESDDASLQALSQQAYTQIFSLLKASGYGCLIRIWNYFPAITAPNAQNTQLQSEDLNRYHAFCLGRQAALDAHDNFAYSPPAATAIGTRQGGLQVYFIAAKQAGVQLENPRQTSAFLYPRQYGPVSPAFSRATVKAWDKQDQYQHIYISGTASIVGYETLHVGDVKAQLQETLRNLDALLVHGDETLGLPIQHLSQIRQLKVYIHDKSKLTMIREHLDAFFAEQAAFINNPTQKPVILYLQGDVCRADLLVEMEAIYA